jgi:deoxyribodipyrimidine photo-lyase
MTASRRPSWNFALDRALRWTDELGVPLLVFEPLRAGYAWASERIHRFVIEGMADHRRAFARAGVTYFPYVEPRHGEGRGLLDALARDAAIVVTDDYPGFFLPRMLESAAAQAGCTLEAVDSNGLVPVRAASRAYPSAFQFRRHLHAVLTEHLLVYPTERPFHRRRKGQAAVVPPSVLDRWPPADLRSLLREGGLSEVAIAREPAPVPGMAGGPVAARRALDRFLSERYERYGDARNDPDADGTSRLSAYLHFGHLSVHQVAAAVFDREGWSPDRVRAERRGRREGWWGMSASGEGFLDELVTWREIGFNAAVSLPAYDRFDSLPEWARRTLGEHAADPRTHLYPRAALEAADTHDTLWNAAQRQLLSEGRIHGYLRMLWGKKILEWSESPEDAFETMVQLNNRYALDGRDPNSWSGIAWVLGRYDRPWGPERPVFGTVRYMSSENTARKLSVRRYLERYGAGRE